MNDELESELLAAARRGDASAAPFLVSYYGERLLGYARAHAPDLSDADRERIVELAIEAAVRAIDRYDPSRGSLSGWFRGQIRYRTLAWRRANPALRELPDVTERSYSPVEVDERSGAEVRRALALLGRDHQVILALRTVEQLSHAEIGLRLGITEDASRQRHHRALQRLAAELASSGTGVRPSNEATDVAARETLG